MKIENKKKPIGMENHKILIICRQKKNTDTF